MDYLLNRKNHPIKGVCQETHWLNDRIRLWITYADEDRQWYEYTFVCEEIRTENPKTDPLSTCVLVQRAPHNNILLSERRIARLELHYGLCVRPDEYKAENVILIMTNLYPIEWWLSPLGNNDPRGTAIVELHVRFSGLVTYNVM